MEKRTVNGRESKISQRGEENPAGFSETNELVFDDDVDCCRQDG